MERAESKRLLTLRILNILEKYSDKEHPLTQPQIIEMLKEIYGISCERKAVGRHLELLKDADYDIVYTNRKGFYLGSKNFEPAELRLLIDSVLSSKHINAKHSRDLIQKLTKMGGESFCARLSHIQHINDWQKSTNLDFFLNIEVLDEAIEKQRKVAFFYNRFDEAKKLKPTSTDKRTVSPYQMLLHNQHYYLIGKFDKYDTLTFFRLDKITNIEITDLPLTPVTTVAGHEKGLNLPEMTSALPYLYFEPAQKISLKIPNRMINELVDWFGTNFIVIPNSEDECIAMITASQKAVIHWIMQYNENVEVLSPLPLRNEVIEKIRRLNAIYGLDPQKTVEASLPTHIMQHGKVKNN